MPDVPDARVYLAGAAAILAEYPSEVHAALSDPRTGTKLLKEYPSLHDIRKACDLAYEPIGRQLERTRAFAPALPAPQGPDQATRDKQIEDYQRRVKPVLMSAFQSVPIDKPKPVGDGKHAMRIAADLAARKARNDAQASTGPPSNTAA